ncbi:hypothetical protein GCM10022226_12780 [Sphaerisporangium flaviroseum]|uniref:Uncharacterized protein n=1 Tax=Sphaerisporangium flaviroseum TaxID=509199 RepID=A0ABP7HKJ7_9ACTN
MAEHDARYGEEGAGPPEWVGCAGVGTGARPPGTCRGRLVHDDAVGMDARARHKVH